MLKKFWFLSIIIIIAIIFPFIVQSSYYIHIVILILIWGILGVAWNLLGGYTGQVSFGHATFFGLGAYGAGLLIFHLHISTWWGMIVGPIVAVIIGIPIGLICFRLRGPYFALAMLAVGEICRLVFTEWVSFTNGAMGILTLTTFSSKLPYYYIGLAMLLLSIYTVHRLMNSRAGYYFVSIREDQDAAESLGIPTAKYKMYSLIPSVFFSGLAGAFYMNYMNYIEPSVVFSLPDVSIMIILVVILGGVATLWGPVIGAIIYVILSELFRSSLGPAHLLVFGVIVCLVIMYMPNGIMGEANKIKKLFRRKGTHIETELT